MFALKNFRLKVFGATFFQKGSEKHQTQTNFNINIDFKHKICYNIIVNLKEKEA